MAIQTIKLGGYVDEEVKKINDNFTEIETDYAKKTEIPEAVTVPTNVSAFTNDAGYQTAAQVTQAVNSAVGAIDVPTKTSELTNDSNFATTAQVNSAVNAAVGDIDIPTVPTKVSEFTNDAGYVKASDTAFINKVDAVQGKALSTNDYTNDDKAKVARLGKIDFTTSNFTADSNGDYVATLPANGKYPVKVMRKNGTEYEEVIAHTKISGNNIIVVSAEAFEGFVVTV